MKCCSLCNIEKEDFNFYSGRAQCIHCIKIRRKEEYKEKAEYIKTRQRNYNKSAKEKISLNKKQYYLDNKEIITIKKKEYNETNKEKRQTQCREYWHKNKEKKHKYQRRRYYENPEKSKEACRKWAKENRHLTAALGAKRRASKKQATPAWLTKDHFNQIKEIYKKAKELEKQDGIKRHVDHIIPLRGKIVSGLHVPWNLQILTASENSKKRNKLLDKYLS